MTSNEVLNALANVKCRIEKEPPPVILNAVKDLSS
jgi:hypothetical protein